MQARLYRFHQYAIYPGGNPRGSRITHWHAQFDKAHSWPAKCALGSIRVPYVHLSTSFTRSKVKLARVQTTGDLWDQWPQLKLTFNRGWGQSAKYLDPRIVLRARE